MRNALMTFAAAMVLALAMTACGGKTPSETAKSAGQSVDDAAKATANAVGDAAKATGEFLTQSKDEAVKDAQKALNAIENKWQDLRTRAAPTTDEAKADIQKAEEQMAQILADAKAKLIEAKDAGADAWQRNIKPALDAALQKAHKLYEDTAAKFSKK
jgi:predicted small lipoprotein YifL